MSTCDVLINDVSLRDGIQSEKILIPLATKLAIARTLIAAGVRSLQITSFVNPLKVPQMADAESLVANLNAPPGVILSALVLNERGLDRLIATKLGHVDLSLSTSDAHSRRNSGMSLDEARRQAVAMTKRAKTAGLKVRAGLQCVFGCYDAGKISPELVVSMVEELVAAGCDTISLADSTGLALPDDIKRMVAEVRTCTDLPLVLHLHDTRGLGMANVMAGFEAGVRTFDAALGGVGGCPFIAGASGNVAIEDLVHWASHTGLASGISLPALAPAGQLLEEALNKALPGRVYQLAKRSPALAAYGLPT